MNKNIFYPATLLILLLFSSRVYSQKATDSTKKDSAALSSISSKLDEILKMVNDAKTSDKEKTGIIYFDTSDRVTIYTANGKRTQRTIQVDKMNLLMQDGYIVDMQVFSGTRVFTNTKAPITLDSKRFSRTGKYTDHLQNKNNRDEFIILQEAIFYEPLSTFFPEDGFLQLSKKKFLDTLARNVGVNTVLDLRLYTDALASLGDEPNGILLTDLRFKQFLHRKHAPNSGARGGSYVKLNLTASKLDSKHDFVDSGAKISRAQLIQRNKFNAELLVNVVSGWLGKKTLNNYYLDIGGGFSNVNLAGLKDTSTIKTQSLFTEFGMGFINSSNIGFHFHLRGIIQYSPNTDFNEQHKAMHFLRVGGEVFWNPFGEPASRIFARINFIKGLSHFENKNSFSQVQLGYSTLLSKAIGK